MDLFDKQFEIRKYGDSFVQSINDQFDFAFMNLFYNDAKEAEIDFLSKAFDLIISKKDEKLDIYLWNKTISDIQSFNDKVVLPKNMSTYINDVKKHCDNLCNKYNRELYEMIAPYSININKDFSNDFITLKAPSKQDGEIYCDFFLNNKEEYENYYNREYDKDDITNANPFLYRNLMFSIYKNNELVGFIGLSGKNKHKYNIEYFIFPKYRGHNYTFYALDLLLNELRNDKISVFEATLKDFVFNEVIIKPKYISFKIRPDNISSIRVAEKIGATYDGIEKASDILKDKIIDHNLYTLEV